MDQIIVRLAKYLGAKNVDQIAAFEFCNPVSLGLVTQEERDRCMCKAQRGWVLNLKYASENQKVLWNIKIKLAK